MMKKSILTGGILALAMLFANLSANNLPETQSIQQSVHAETMTCENLVEFLKKEYLNTGKAEEDGNIRIIGLQKKDAFSKALEICIKLKAKQVPSNDDDWVFQLPDELGYIIVREIYDDNLYIRVILDISCNKLPFTELRMVSLKYYNSK